MHSAILTLVFVVISLPALASECPALIAEFEQALKTTQATGEVVEEAKQLIEQARAQDASGQGDLCIDTAEQALATLAQ
jgi:hypothetical protein